MNEYKKTALFIAAAVAVVLIAQFFRPTTDTYNIDDLRGTQLVEEFPVDAPKQLRITRMPSETGEPQVFEVAEVAGLWTLPSKAGYPADATEQMATAVEGLAGREVLAAIQASSGDHATYGLLDPSDTSAESGSDSDSDTSFGTRIQLSGGDKKTLADLIVGNAVKEATGQYYVRKANQDVVYQVTFDLEKFSTNFTDWIEKDLLALNPLDVVQVSINDYTIRTRNDPSGRPQAVLENRSKMRLAFDESSNQWQAKSLFQFSPQKQKFELVPLAPNEQINSEALEGLKTALDDLLIVDVERKPEGLSSNLQAGKELTDSVDKILSLAQRGFIPAAGENGKTELLSVEGEVNVTLNNGVEYVLRFGSLKHDSTEEATSEKGTEQLDEPGEDKNEAGLNRYLFVMARFNESIVPKPQPLKIPGETASAAGDEEETKESDEEKKAQEERAAKQKQLDEINKQRENQYQELLAAGRKRVDELNARFGDWYYVIPNDVFQKIHLGLAQVVTQKQSPEGSLPPSRPAPPRLSLRRTRRFDPWLAQSPPR